MVLSIAVTALIFAVPSFFLSIYLAVKLSVMAQQRAPGLSQASQENTLRALAVQPQREDDTLTPDAMRYDYGISEENF